MPRLCGPLPGPDDKDQEVSVPVTYSAELEQLVGTAETERPPVTTPRQSQHERHVAELYAFD